jgi:hypothetical protein
MKTEDLIETLVADTRTPAPLTRTVMTAIAIGAVASAVLFQTTLGLRTDVADALAMWRFQLKMVLVAASVGLAAVICVRAGRPQAARPWSLAVPIAVVLAAAIVLELVVTPRADWLPKLLGTNALMCAVTIPALSIVPMLTLMLAMRSAAPASPVRAGGAIGAVSGAIGAALYATHCFDDSPLFVATWYTVGVLPVIMAGALFGRRLLRW